MISTYTHGFSFLQKFEGFEKFKNFKSYKENQFKCKIKVLHSKNVVNIFHKNSPHVNGV